MPLDAVNIFSKYLRCVLILAVLVLSACGNLPDMETGKKAYEAENYAAAQYHYQTLAEFGLPQAKTELGKMYLYGRGVNTDPEKALVLFEEARAGGETTVAPRFIPKAQTKAGAIAIERGDMNGMHMLEQAAAAGDAQALYEQAKLYQQGEIIPKNTDRAIQLYQNAADKGYHRAYIELGKIYEKGKDVRQDYQKAENYYALAKRNGLETDKDLARIQAKSG